MGGLNDLVADLAIDEAGFVKALLDSAKELDRFAVDAIKSMARVETSIEPVTDAIKRQSAEIEREGRTWREFGGQATESMQRVGGSAGRAALPIGGALAVLSRWMPGLRPLSITLTTVGGLFRRFGGDSKDAANQIANSNARAAASTGLIGAAAVEARAKTSPFLSMMGVTAVAGFLAYRSGVNEVIEASGRHLKSGSALRTATGELMSAFNELGAAVVGQFTEGLKGSAVAVLQATTGFESITDAVDWSAKTVTSWARSTTKGLQQARDAAYEAGAIFSTALAIFHGADEGEATAFYNEGKALRTLAEETARVIAKQEAQRDAIKTILAVEEQATAKAQQSARMQQIASMDNVEAIEAELKALRAKVALNAELMKTDGKGKFVSTEGQNIAEQMAGLTTQKIAVESGTYKPPKDAATEQLAAQEAALYRLEFGERAAAIAAYRLTGANDDQVQKFREVLQAQEEKKRADKQFEEQARAMADAIDEQNRLQAQATSRIAAMRDEIDLLNGSATKTEILMRQWGREGFNADQIAEMAELQQQLEDLGKKPDKAKGGKDTWSAALQGSADAAELVLRGTSGLSSQGKQDALIQQQTKATLQMAGNLERGLQIRVEEVTLS